MEMMSRRRAPLVLALALLICCMLKSQGEIAHSERLFVQQLGGGSGNTGNSHSRSFLPAAQKSTMSTAFVKITLPEAPRFVQKFFTKPRNIKQEISVGDIIVPIIGGKNPKWFDIRREMFQQGAYPGVEYEVLGICGPKGEEVLSMGDIEESQRDKAKVVIEPIYPLVDKLERDWPVQIETSLVPVFISRSMYNYGTVVGAAASSFSFFAAAFVISQFFSFYFIPSHSMEPTLAVGDVLFVEKISRSFGIKEGDVILFSPPPKLQEVVARNGGQLGPRDLFVKRAAAGPGRRVAVTAAGGALVDGRPAPRQPGPSDPSLPEGLLTLIAPKVLGGGTTEGEGWVPSSDAAAAATAAEDRGTVGQGEVFVLGDNPHQSVDSRVWGSLPKSNVVGHPVLRIFPLERFGLIR